MLHFCAPGMALHTLICLIHTGQTRRTVSDTWHYAAFHLPQKSEVVAGNDYQEYREFIIMCITITWPEENILCS